MTYIRAIAGTVIVAWRPGGRAHDAWDAAGAPKGADSATVQRFKRMLSMIHAYSQLSKSLTYQLSSPASIMSVQQALMIQVHLVQTWNTEVRKLIVDMKDEGTYSSTEKSAYKVL